MTSIHLSIASLFAAEHFIQTAVKNLVHHGKSNTSYLESVKG